MTASSRSSILIVEDDTLFQSIYHTRLGEEGYAVRVANNGQDALREVEVSPPDIILLDLILPQLNGYEVLERLRADERFSQIPVIVLTNRGGAGGHPAREGRRRQRLPHQDHDSS